MLAHFFHFNLIHWVSTLGYLGVFLIIFCESGVFLGCFLPGDSLLFTAGMLAQQRVFHLPGMLITGLSAAILGYVFGYVFGDKLGHWLVKRPDGIIFKRKYITQAHEFFEKHGGQALIMCRLVPIVRTFCPIVAGMGEMTFSRFMTYTLIGATIWVVGLVLIGYYLGHLFPSITHLMLPIILGIIFISVLPGIYHMVKARFA